MPLFTNALPTFFFLPNSSEFLSPYVFPFVVYVADSRSSAKSCKKLLSLNLTAAWTKRRCLLLSSKGMCSSFSGIVRRCKGLYSEGDFALEAEILEFMKNSMNPEAFPSKKELIDGGRGDLVGAIEEKGGWLSLGWNLDEEEDEGVCQNYLENRETVMAVDSESSDEFSGSESDDTQRFGVASSHMADSSPSSSFNGRSLERVADDESGIEGMLSRLEREREATFGIGFPVSFGKNNWHSETTTNGTVVGQGGSNVMTSISAEEGKWNDLEDNLTRYSPSLETNGLRDSVSPEMHRTCNSYRREDEVNDREFEANEIVASEGRNGKAFAVLRNEALGSRGESIISNLGQEGINHDQIRRHLQHLELELSSIVCSLRSNSSAASHKDKNKSSDDLLKLSDAWEFQENEVLVAKNKLRSMRAKLAVAEGKLALSIIDAQRMIEEKQKRVNSTRKALQALRTACVVWPNSASEVLLAGSFDGWTTQRKMEKSSTGVFSLFLKLYPGRYEIKFIVDGQWKIDPLRPIVNSNGYENNVLIIT